MFGKRKKDLGPSGGSILRAQALTGDLPGLPTDAAGRASLALMDMSMGGGIATVASYVDGTTSMYLSGGGGVIGVGTHPQANAESRAFVAMTEAAIGSLTVTRDFNTLGPGQVRFLLRVGDDVYGAECAQSEIVRGEHPFHPLWVQGQRVLTLIRLISEERKDG